MANRGDPPPIPQAAPDPAGDGVALNPKLRDFLPTQYTTGTSITGWLKTLEDYFALTSIGDQHKLKILRVLLNPELRDWIDELPAETNTYPLVRKAIIGHVTGTDDEYTARANFKAATRKPNETIEEYKTRLLRFGEVLGHTEDSMTIRDKLLESLPEDIAQTISIAAGRAPVAEVIQRIKMYEGQQKAKASNRPRQQQQQLFQTDADMSELVRELEQQQQQQAYAMNGPVICFRCRKPGHMAKDCRSDFQPNVTFRQNDDRVQQLEQKIQEMETRHTDLFKEFASAIKESLEGIRKSNDRGRSPSRYSSRRRDYSNNRSQSRDRRQYSRDRRPRRNDSHSRPERDQSRSSNGSNRQSYSSSSKAARNRSTSTERYRDKNRQ